MRIGHQSACPRFCHFIAVEGVDELREVSLGKNGKEEESWVCEEGGEGEVFF